LGPQVLLYAILDAGLCEATALVESGAALLEAGVDLLQLRGKELSARELLEASRQLLPRCREAQVPFLVNDRLDVALAAGADGVHLGQADLPFAAARELMGSELILGGSTHDLAEIREAEAVADYLGFGALFPTNTRPDSRIRGPQALTEAVAATTLPMFAIGGIEVENLGQLKGCGMAGIAVASALLRGSSRREAVERLRRALQTLG
jgi:thiamine-phosphate diphosphorylase